jgi:hypothetical protein
VAYRPTSAKAAHAEARLRTAIRTRLQRMRNEGQLSLNQLALQLDIPPAQVGQLLGLSGATPVVSITLRTFVRILEKLHLRVELVKE